MQKYSFNELKDKIDRMIDLGVEPEVNLSMYGKDYMIIGYNNKCSFQRCGSIHDGSGEFYYDTLDELYNSVTVDEILLKRDWDDIEEIYSAEYEWGYTEEEYQAALAHWKEISSKF